MVLDTASITEHENEISESIFLRTAEWMVYSYCLDLYGGCIHSAQVHAALSECYMYFLYCCFLFSCCFLVRIIQLLCLVLSIVLLDHEVMFLYLPYFLKMINDVHVFTIITGDIIV